MRFILPEPIWHGSTEELATRRPFDRPITLGLVDNGRDLSIDMLQAIATALQSRGFINKTVIISNAVTTLGEDDRAALLDGADAVVAGVGSCGSCTSRTVHDALTCDMAGIPAVPILTEVFLSIARGVSASLGHPDYPFLTIPHPMWTRSPEWFDEMAASLCQPIVSRLTGSADRDDRLSVAASA
jgi:hypothetical protein